MQSVYKEPINTIKALLDENIRIRMKGDRIITGRLHVVIIE